MKLVLERSGVYEGHGAGLYTLLDSGRPGIFYSGGSDSIIAAWDVNTEKVVFQLPKLPSYIYALCHGNEGKIFAGLYSGHLAACDTDTKTISRISPISTQALFDLHYFPETQQILAACADGNLLVVDADSLELVKTIPVCREKVRAIAVDKEKKQIFLASGDGSIRILEFPDFKESANWNAHGLSANSLLLSENGKYLFSGGRDAHLRIWNRNDNYALVKEIPAHNFALYSMAELKGKGLFATASRDKNIRIWDMETFAPLVTISKEKSGGHRLSVNKIILLTKEERLISCGDDRMIYAWKIEKT